MSPRSMQATKIAEADAQSSSMRAGRDAAQLQVAGNANIHFDEELSLETGLILGYELVSWQEIQVAP